MYLQVVKRIIKCNFLHWENEFMINIINMLKSSDQVKILFSLKIFNKLAKLYEFSDDKDIYLKNLLIIQKDIENIMEKLTMNSESFSNETLNFIINSILKIYQSSTKVYRFLK